MSLLPATRPRATSRPLPWPVVAAAALAIIGGLAFLTVYLPALQAARQGNVVRVQDLTLRLSAQPDGAYQHGVALEVAVDPPLASCAGVELAPSMPTMGSMRAETSAVHQTGPGSCGIVADLGMGGLWQVQVTVHRPVRPAAVARFRLNA